MWGAELDDDDRLAVEAVLARRAAARQHKPEPAPVGAAIDDAV
jgi:hypothetical protein